MTRQEQPEPSKSNSKTTEELLLGAENQALASAAIRRAADRAQLLELRRQARAEKAARDLEDLEFHREVVELLYAGGQVNQEIKRQALERVQLWENRQLCIPRYSSTWREWLAMPPEFARRAILNETDLGVSMRCNTPFDFLRGQWNKNRAKTRMDGQGDESQIEIIPRE